MEPRISAGVGHWASAATDGAPLGEVTNHRRNFARLQSRDLALDTPAATPGCCSFNSPRR